jgi:cysteine synthase B
MGVGRFLKEQNPDVQLWAIEPPSGEMVDGLRNLEDGYIPPIFIECHGEELLDRKTVVRPKESIEWTRRLADIGLFVGISSGAIMAGAVRCAEQIPPGEKATIVTIECDDGWKYLSTGAWTEDIDEVVERAKRIIYF